MEVCSGAARGPESSGSSAQTRPAGNCSSEAAGAEAGQGEPTAVLLLSQKWDRLR